MFVYSYLPLRDDNAQEDTRRATKGSVINWAINGLISAPKTVNPGYTLSQFVRYLALNHLKLTT